MSAPRDFLAGFAKSVLVHRHAFVPSPARALEIGRAAELPASFAEALASPGSSAAQETAAAARQLWRPGGGARSAPLENLLDRYASLEGLKALGRAARAHPRWTPARLYLALAYLRRVDLARAWKELDALAAARPDWSWPLLVRSELGRVDIVFDRALKDLDAAEKLDPANAWIHAFRARVLFQKEPGRRA